MSDRDQVTMRRDASAAIGTFDENARTVEVVWAAGAAVKRYSWDDGYYMEELSMDPKHIRLDRFRGGMSLLDSHDASSMESRLGTVMPGSVRISGGKAYATIKLSRKARAEELFQDLRDGHGFPVSVGYRTHAYEKREGDRKSLPTLCAVDWEPMELTACPVPADAGAHSRKDKPAMTTKNKTNTPPLEPTDEDLERAPAFGRAERQALARRLGFDDAFVRRHARKSEDAFREAMIEEAASRYEETRTGGYADLLHRDDPADRVHAMAEALHYRIAPQADVSERAREYIGLTMPEMARICLRNVGQPTTGMAPSQLVTRALHTTSDFPQILGSTVGRSLREAYEAAPAPIKSVARKTTARDFRAKHAIAFSESPTLEKVNEHGEFKSGTMKEGSESYKIDTFGKIFGITRQALVNDDLGAFEQIPTKLGRAAKAFEASFLTDLVQVNPVMGDGKALFHVDHKNLAAPGTYLSAASLSVARLAMRRQTGLAAELIAVAPKFLIVAPELETQAEKLLAEIAAATADSVNVFSKSLTLIVEPRLSLNSGLTWYLAAGTNEIDGLEYAHLEGNEEPQIETKAGFEVDGVQIRVRLDFGAGWVDHRGWYKNAGAAAP